MARSLPPINLFSMRRGYSTPLVIAIMAFAVVSFLFLIDTSMNPDGTRKNTNVVNVNVTSNQNTNTVACTMEAKQCPDGSYVGRSGPNCEFSDCPVTNTNSVANENVNKTTNENTNTVIDITANWKTYSNQKYGLSFKYPEDWTVTEKPVSYLNIEYDGVQAYTSADSTVPQFAVTMFPMKFDQTDPFTNFTLSTNIVQSTATPSDIVIAGIFGRFFKGFPTLTPPNSAFIDHNTVTFKLDQGGETSTWDNIIRTFSFIDGNVDLDNTNPIKSVTEISSLINWPGEGGLRAVSVMGTNALISGGGYLYFYDGKKITDISEKIALPGTSGSVWKIVSGPIANNGNYWLIATIEVGGKGHLYSFDGEMWQDLSDALDAAVPRTVYGGETFSWNGSYWLMAVDPGHIVKYDGHTFVDLTSQVPNIEEPRIFGRIVWNGSYFIFAILTGGNHDKLYRYDGTTFSVVPGLDPSNYVNEFGWNGNYWLLSGFAKQHLMKYDGAVITDLGYPQNQQAKVEWLKSLWLVGPWFFDGKTLDTTTPFNVGYRVNSLSLGTNYGIMLGENGTVYRFDY